VSRSGYYAWVKRDDSIRNLKELKLSNKIREAFEKSRKIYGSPRLHSQLKADGINVSRAKVARKMKALGIKSKSFKKHRYCESKEKHCKFVADNLLDRGFEVTQKNKVWLGDITYIDTNQGWLYLAAVLDMCTRKIVGWAMSENIDSDLSCTALNMAIGKEHLGEDMIFHSDRGVQYACSAFKNTLTNNAITPSMSRKGNCWDNAPMESFFHSLKTEWTNHQSFKTRLQARQSIFEWIEVFYNRERIHSSLGYKSPLAYEEELVLKAA